MGVSLGLDKAVCCLSFICLSFFLVFILFYFLLFSFFQKKKKRDPSTDDWLTLLSSSLYIYLDGPPSIDLPCKFFFIHKYFSLSPPSTFSGRLLLILWPYLAISTSSLSSFRHPPFSTSSSSSLPSLFSDVTFTNLPCDTSNLVISFSFFQSRIRRSWIPRRFSLPYFFWSSASLLSIVALAWFPPRFPVPDQIARSLADPWNNNKNNNT